MLLVPRTAERRFFLTAAHVRVVRRKQMAKPNQAEVSLCAEHTDGKAVPNGGAYSNFDFWRMSREIIKSNPVDPYGASDPKNIGTADFLQFWGVS